MQPKRLKTHISLQLGIPLTIILLITFILIAWLQNTLIFREFNRQAAVLVQQIIYTRQWVLHYDGLWVSKKEGTVVKEQNGMYLKTPSIMTKEISRMVNEKGTYTIRMTAFRPISPENYPSEIERKALLAFEKGEKLFTGTFDQVGEKMFLYMVPVYTEAKCVSCHAAQDYKEGDLRGGLGVILPLEPTLAAINKAWLTYFVFGVTIVVLVLGMIYIFFNRRILYPLSQLQELAYKFGQGKLEERLSINSSIEFSKMAITFNEMAEKLQSSYIKNQELNELAVTDGLTGLYNHWFFHETLEKSVQAAKKDNLVFTLVLMDIDNFKDFNDTHGHLAGDVVLKRVAQMITKSIKAGAMAFRYGGEEFAVIMPGTPQEEGFNLADKIRKAIDSLKIFYNKEQLHVTVSMGIATYPADALGKNGLIDRSDEKLYLAKNSGKNIVCK